MPNHPLLHPLVSAAPPQPQWPSFTGSGTFVGTSPSGLVNVWYDASLGAEGLANAQALAAGADGVIKVDSSIFGTPDQLVNVIIFALQGRTDGTGGADHMGCDWSTGQNIEVCAAFGRDDRILALFEAELSEDQMRGQLCGMSTGEALSRWCAMVVAPAALSDFASAPVWQQQGQSNWVDQTEPTDQNYPSIGCGMAFLSWLQHEGQPLNKIAPAMVGLGDSGTLAQLYQGLTGKTTAWTDFMAAVQALPGPITSDDPFAGAPTPPPPPPPGPPPPGPPPPPPPAGGNRVVIVSPLAPGVHRISRTAAVIDYRGLPPGTYPLT